MRPAFQALIEVSTELAQRASDKAKSLSKQHRNKNAHARTIFDSLKQKRARVSSSIPTNYDLLPKGYDATLPTKGYEDTISGIQNIKKRMRRVASIGGYHEKQRVRRYRQTKGIDEILAKRSISKIQEPVKSIEKVIQPIVRAPVHVPALVPSVTAKTVKKSMRWPYVAAGAIALAGGAEYAHNRARNRRNAI